MEPEQIALIRVNQKGDSKGGRDMDEQVGAGSRPRIVHRLEKQPMRLRKFGDKKRKD
jgi:hypothetical protein